MLDYRIETFLTLCETKNYTKTAMILCMTQPAVTQHIKYLEKYYQCKLILFEGKQLKITRKGEELYRLAKTMKSNANKIMEEMRQDEEENILIHLGATKSIADYIVPKAISNYLHTYKKTHINIRTDNTENLLKQLRNGEVDIILLEGNFNKQEYGYEILREEPFICISSYEQKNEKITEIEHLFSERIFLREKGSGTRSILENYLTEHSYTMECFKNQMEVDNLNTIKRMVEEKLGISFIYKMVVENELKEKRLREVLLTDFPIHKPLYFVYLKESLYVEKYIDFINKFRDSLENKHK